DAVQPAAELRLAAEERQLLVGVEEGFLQHFLRVGLRAGHAQGQPVELPLVAVHRLLERLRVALLGALYQLAVAGLSVGPRFLGSGLVWLRVVGQGARNLKQAQKVVKPEPIQEALARSFPPPL